MAMLGGASFRRADPYRSGDARTFTEITNYAPASRASDAFSVATGWGKAVVTLGGAGRAQVSYTRQDATHVLYPYLMMDGIWDVTDRASVRFDRTTDGPIDALQAQISFTRVDHWMTDEYRTSGAGTPRAWSMGTQADTATTGARIEATVDALTTGVEVVRRAWTASTMLGMRQYAAQASIPGVVIGTAGAFADWHRPLGSRASFEAGARIDYAASAADESLANTNLYDAYQRTRSTSRRDVLPAVKAGVSGQAGPVHLTLSAGHTTRVAEANERYYALQRMGTDWVGNPDLSPVRHTGLDLAATWTRGAASVAAQAYVSRIADYITVYDQARVQMVPGVMNTMARSYANVDASLRGFELSASAPVRPGLALSGDLSYVRGWQDGDAARGIAAAPLAEMPALRGRARLRWDAARWFAQAEQVVTGDQNRVDASLGEAPTPGAALTNLSAGLRWHGVSLAAGVTNVFDRYVVDALSYQRDPFRTGVRVPEPGRQWFANVSWRY
jgi:iron complex outermembrane receptor protein